MQRHALQALMAWKKSIHRKPLIVQGARQVGKTWLLHHFGEQAYDNVVAINFDKNPGAATIFEPDLDPERIIRALELSSGEKIDAEGTLILFDEVQEAPRALASVNDSAMNCRA